jgi:peroxisomal membrane protein 4
MVFLFQQGPIRDKIRRIVKVTFEHTKNLAVFVGIYKAVLSFLRQAPPITGKPNLQLGKPASPWHAAIAGAVGGYLVWANYSSVNYQIVMYLFSRIIISTVKLFAAKGYQPFTQYCFVNVYPVFATCTWATVMWLYENHADTLHPSLRKSMDFLYNESCEWKNGVRDFLPSPATAAVCLLTWFNV